MNGLRWRGIYRFGVQYEIDDVVYFADNGFTYVCVRPSKNYPPNFANSGFELLAGFDPSILLIDGGEF